MSHLHDRSTFTRRRLLAGGGLLAAGMFAGGGLANAGRPSVARSAARAGRRPRSGDLPTLSQWYHEYGEAGTQDAVLRYAEAYEEANIEVEWVPGDYTTAVTSALLTDEGPDVFEFGNGPSIDMILNGQVVPLDGILGDAESDFNERMIQRLTYDGHLWAVPQVVDMQLLVYRKSMLEEAGVELPLPLTLDDLISAAAALTTGDTKGLFLGNDGGVGVLGGPLLWSAGADYLTADNEPGFTTDAVYESFAKVHELFESDSLLLGAPTDWFDPGAFIQGLTAMQWTGLWTFPQIAAELGDDFDVAGWPAADASTGTPSVPIGAFASTVAANSVDVEASKAFVQWLWVDQTIYQEEFALAFGFHIPSRISLAEGAVALASGPASNAVLLTQRAGFTQTPILWSPAADTAYADARTRIIAEGADPETELAPVAEIAQQELDRILSGSGGSASSAPAASSPASDAPASSAPAGTAPATTG
jgi:multiple sugar transport system substrate-binding protein